MTAQSKLSQTMIDNRFKMHDRILLGVALIAGIMMGTQLPLVAQPVLGQASSSVSRSNLRSYIGLTYRQLPTGFKDNGGWVVKGGRYRADFVQRGNTRMIWFTKVLKWDRGGAVPVQVVDVMELPTFPRSQELHYAFCRLDGVNDREIFAIAEATHDDIRTTIYRAWRANTKTEKIEPISTKGVACPQV
ncbi:MAG: hypothetical protein J0L70_29160 [Leptolyngbya sp. UWPOB_LEPTO1]|uniref:hypothetical protein n=1 Tax=Leptolyngbya sp. UWPOB_LEPTO1 TaxID=2815653 RepID=UPI001AC619A6|nr:hypothetical protein [Leptolyngbya sp. UWPOB_LEPTO1]MBN8564606.1 hypothetical protein [Leptolyngbya sp. UWPOB_LEPTO1]